jgi:hypothetical protein
MAYYFLTASKDATVYLQQPNQNTGLDEILEISKIYYGNIKDVSHALLKFEVGYLSASLSNASISMEDATLILKETKSEELPLTYTIYANPISGSWEMGIGTRFDNISTQGVTWNYREGDTKLNWLENNFNLSTTASADNGTGGTWWSNYEATQNFDYQTADINIDIKDLLQNWMSGSIENDGIILRHSVENEVNTENYGIIKLFSKETNTIYQPKIRIGWDDQIFNTGSLSPLITTGIKVSISNLKKEYKSETIQNLRVFGRELYPVKTFTNVFGYSNIKYLPNTTYYQIKDFSSNDVIIPFSEYSKVSCDSQGNYIKINFSNWEVDRTYKIEFKIDVNGSSEYFDDNLTFMLVKN